MYYVAKIHLKRQAIGTFVPFRKAMRLNPWSSEISSCWIHLSSSARDEEPLVDARINWGRSQVLILWDVRKLVWADTVVWVLDGEVGSILLSTRNSRGGAAKAYVEISPGLVLPVINFSQASAHSRTMSVAYLYQLVSISVRKKENILLVLALSSESKLVLWLSIWDLVDSEPFICSPQKTRKVSLNILNIIELWCQWVVDVDNNNLPVGLFLIKQSHNT